VTIPDLGHCAGTGTSPVDGSTRQEGDGTRTGLCPACSGRAKLDPTGVLSIHDAAELEDREDWPETAS
jgi:hypothetical protein